MVVGIYIVFGLIALAIDRRALLVSALAYVLFAMTELFRTFGAIELNVALTAFVVGSALLMLSAFWQNAQAVVVGMLPADVANQLPATIRPQPASCKHARRGEHALKTRPAAGAAYPPSETRAHMLTAPQGGAFFYAIFGRSACRGRKIATSRWKSIA